MIQTYKFVNYVFWLFRGLYMSSECAVNRPGYAANLTDEAYRAVKEKYRLLMRARRLPQEAKDAGFIGTTREWRRFKASLENK